MITTILHMTILTTVVLLMIAANAATLALVVLIAVVAEMYVAMEFVVIYSAAVNR